MKKLILIIGILICANLIYAQTNRTDTKQLFVRDQTNFFGSKLESIGIGTALTDGIRLSQLNDTIAKYAFTEPRDSILFSNEISDLIHQEGKFYYDSIKQSWVGYIGELDVTFEFMYEDWIRVFNNTGQTIANGDVCYLSGVIADANNTPTVGFANAKWDSTAQSALGFATHSIEDGTYGVITKSGTVRDLNTIDLVTSGARLFLDTIDGGRRNTILPSPYYNISLGNAGKIDGSDGTVEVSIGIGNNTQSVISIFNGAELETVTVDVVSDGTDMEVIVSRTGELDISLFFDGEFVVFDAPDTIAITPGTDTIPVRNWVYIPNSTRQLTVNTTGVSVTNGFPTNEQYAPIADIIAPSAATAQARGFNKVHVWTDHVSNSVGQGHLSDLNYWVRKQSATYQEGASLTPDPLEDIFAALIDLAFTSGDHLQLHNHTSPALNTATGDSLKVYNDPDFSNRPIPNLNSTDLNQDSEGGSLTGQYYPVFVWMVVSEDAEDCQLFLNLPSGSYNNSSSALLDASKYINKRLPIEYKGTAVSLYGITLQNSGGNIKIVADGIEDLREDAGTVGGEGGTGGVTSYDELDDTPPSKVGSSLKFPRVNVGESAHEYVTMTSQIGYDGNTKIITSADSLAVKIQRGSGSDTDNVLEILNGAGSVVGEIDGNGDLDVSDITLANNSILNLATLAPGLNTHAEYFIGHGASATWPVSMSTIYDANYVDHYLLMGGVLDGGTKAAPTAAGAPAGGGGYIGMVNLGTLSNSYLDLGRYSAGAGQSLNSILKLFGSGAAIFSDAIEADAYGTTVQTLTETAGAVAWDVSSGAEAGVTIDETSVITITNIPSTGVVYLGIAVTQGDAGDDNVTFVASGYSVFWRDDDQDLSDASGVYDEISLKVVGTKISVTWGGPYVAQ